jgi:hypothetical protein
MGKFHRDAQSSTTFEQQVLPTNKVSLLPLQQLMQSTLQCLIIHVMMSSQAAFQRTKQVMMHGNNCTVDVATLSTHTLQSNSLSEEHCVWPGLVLK